MGLKSGSRDAGLEGTDAEDEATDAEDGTSSERDPSGVDTSDAGNEDHDRPEATDEAEPADAADSPSDADRTGGRPRMSAIPYKLRREKVNEGREQVPYFLREEIIDAEDELQDTLERMVGEDVYKSDYREAAMVVAQRNPELLAEVLREWGYDLEPASG